MQAGIATAATALLVAVGAAACVPPQPPVGGPAQDPTHVIYADSLGAELMGAGYTHDGQTWNVMNGATIFYWLPQIGDSVNLPARVMVLALGGNDAITGWTADDESVWQLVLDSARPETCIVLVLPWATADLDQFYPDGRHQIDLARAWLTSRQRPNTVVVDWAVPVQADPTIMASDGIHIATQPGMQARYDLITGGEAQCPT